MSDAPIEITSTSIDGPAGPIEVKTAGEGHAVLLLPSLGRGADDFADLASRLAGAGYWALCPEPRGIGGSTAPLDDLSMHDLATDAAAVIRAAGASPATVVGHAFGNRVARMIATERPDLVESVVLLACGGLVPAAPQITAALHQVFDYEATPEDHLAAVERAFFAPGNDPSPWDHGWHGVVAWFQEQATRNTPVDHWWGAGRADVLVVQPGDDVLAVPENARLLLEQLGSRASLVTIDHAGHALLPEQPEAVAVTLVDWLARRGLSG